MTPATTPYDGCGKCLVAVRRLSRKNEATHSPEKQADQVLAAAESVGAHIIGWADDWEVSGVVAPLSRPRFGPWLRGERGPYDGIVGAAVDRIGRNVVDVLSTAYAIRENNQILVTADHSGVWDLGDPNQETELAWRALGAQMEHRAGKKRTADESKRARNAGEAKCKLTYGYMYVRLTPKGAVDHVALDPQTSPVIRKVALRILSDLTGLITVASECKRLTREGILTPHDLMAVRAGREPKGGYWTWRTLWGILNSMASLGYLMHKGKPVLDANGEPRQVAPPLWDIATHDALVEKTKPKPNKKASKKKAPSGTATLSDLGYCGNCAARMTINGLEGYGCVGRVRGMKGSEECKPAPTIKKIIAEAEVENWFLSEYGSAQVMRNEFDPGTGYAARILELEKNRKRLRDDRAAGLYEAADDVEWFRTEYARMGREITRYKSLPERPAGMRTVPTGKTVADEWRDAKDGAERRELLAQFNVRVLIYPAAAPQRVKCTGANPYELAV
ncbi:recombinase family protein [Streptomyces sp. NPDC057307]|uniref:recombinase family protein n=1 Tax=Streptomyces sp. NPDC057307 TaxID=3346096 RepID=UPI003630046B